MKPIYQMVLTLMHREPVKAAEFAWRTLIRIA